MLFLNILLAALAAVFFCLFVKGASLSLLKDILPTAGVFGALFAALQIAGWVGAVISVLMLLIAVFMVIKKKWVFAASFKYLAFLLLAVLPACYCLINSLYGIYQTWWSIAAAGTAVIAALAVIIGAFLSEKGVRKLWSVLAAVVLAVALWATAGIVVANAAPADNTKINDKDLQKQKIVVDIDKKTTLSKFSGISKELSYNSLSPKDEERITAAGFNDAVSFPLKGTTAKAQLAELQEEVLRNPVYGVGMARFIGGLKYPDGKNVNSENKWLSEFINKNDSAPNGLNIWLEAESESAPIMVTDEYRRYAAGVATILGQFSNKGTQSRQTIENWPLSLTGLDSQRKMVRDAYPDDQYSDKPSVVYCYTAKNGSKLLEFGINIQDKRPELFGDTVIPTVITTGDGGGSGDNPQPKPNPDPKPDPDPDPDPSGCTDTQTWEPSYGQQAEHNADDGHTGGNVQDRVDEERSTGETESGEIRHSGVTDPEWWTKPEVTDNPTTSGGEGTPDISEGNNEGGGLLTDD